METRLATRVAQGATISGLSSPTADFAFNAKKITNLADPVSPQDAATRKWVLDQLTALGVSSYPSSYTVVLNVGDIPSNIESWAATGDKDGTSIATSTSYTNQSGSQGYYTVNLRTSPTGPFGTGSYDVIVGLRSLRSGTPSTLDNDVSVPLVCNKTASSF